VERLGDSAALEVNPFERISNFRDGRHTGQREPEKLAAKMSRAIRDIDAQMAQGNH
jgi:hypothetical protein